MFVADHKEPEKRRIWLEQKWPEILKLAEKKNADILAVSFAKVMKKVGPILHLMKAF